LLLTLEDCQRIALENNKDIQKAKEYRNTVMGRYWKNVPPPSPIFRQWPISITGGTNRRRIYTAAFSFLSRRSGPPRSGYSALVHVGRIGRRSGRPRSAWRPRRINCGFISRRRFGMCPPPSRMSSVQGAPCSGPPKLEQKVRTQREARRRLAGGSATDYDALAADVAVDNARPAVIRAENLIRISRRS